MIAVSTAYNAKNHETGRAIIEELQALGFRAAELGVSLTGEMLAEIESMPREIEIVSLHNYCPVPEGPRDQGSGDFYFLSSLDGAERRKAVDSTMRTVEWANRLGAKAVVLHAGRVEMADQFDAIIGARMSGQTEKADSLLREDMELREKLKGPHLDAVLASVSEIAERAGGAVRFGIETRVGHTEIPSFDEMAQFMDVLPPSSGGYWHDFGHAQFNQMLGTAKHEDFLKRYGSRMVGMHIHDMLGRNDHGPLTHGTIDFPNLLKLVPSDAIPVLEVHGSATPEQLIRSREIVESLIQ